MGVKVEKLGERRRKGTCHYIKSTQAIQSVLLGCTEYSSHPPSQQLPPQNWNSASQLTVLVYEGRQLLTGPVGPVNCLCTGGVYYVHYLTLLISKLFCRKGCMDGGGGGSSARVHQVTLLYVFATAGVGGKGEQECEVTLHTHPQLPPNPYSSGREGHWKGWALILMYIKSLMYLFFIWCLDLMILMRANPNGTRFARC